MIPFFCSSAWHGKSSAALSFTGREKGKIHKNSFFHRNPAGSCVCNREVCSCKIKIALCDKDKFYCERFAAYMMNHKAQEIELNIYSTIEQFTGDEKMGNFDLVIAGSGFEEFSSDVNIMYLSDLCGNQAAEEAMWEKDTIPQKKIVTKYQPMEQLLHEIYVQAGMTKRNLWECRLRHMGR